MSLPLVKRSSRFRPRHSPKPRRKRSSLSPTCNTTGSDDDSAIMPPSSTMFRRAHSPGQYSSKRRLTRERISIPEDPEMGYRCPHVPFCMGIPHETDAETSSLLSVSRHDLCETVVINVGGRRYETLLSTLSRFPKSLLGDPVRRSRHFNPATKEYFFDRNRYCFDTILELYQTGEGLVKPNNVPIQTFVRELFFYDIGDDIIHEFLEAEGLLRELTVVPKHPVCRYLWTIFDTTDACLAARVIAITNVLFVLMAIVVFCVQTLPQFQTKDIFINGTLAINIDSWGENNASNPFFIIETMCTIWFTLDLVIRLAVCPEKKKFILNVMNVIDILSILPYFVDLALNSPQTQIVGEPSKVMLLTILRILRVIKIFRVFKLGRYSNGLQTLAMTLKAARYEVGLMLVVVSIGVVVFSAAVYYAELGSGNHTQFDSIPGGFWWAIITWTTVGYGDIVPHSVAGKIVGGFCALCGILGLSFMVPVIVAHFEHFFYRAKDLEKLDEVFEEREERKKCAMAYAQMRKRLLSTANGPKLSNGNIAQLPTLDEVLTIDETTKVHLP